MPLAMDANLKSHLDAEVFAIVLDEESHNIKRKKIIKLVSLRWQYM